MDEDLRVRQRELWAEIEDLQLNSETEFYEVLGIVKGLFRQELAYIGTHFCAIEEACDRLVDDDVWGGVDGDSVQGDIEDLFYSMDNIIDKLNSMKRECLKIKILKLGHELYKLEGKNDRDK